MRELITVIEASKRIGVHYQTLYKPVRAGKYKQEWVRRRQYLVWEDGGLVLNDEEKPVKPVKAKGKSPKNYEKDIKTLRAEGKSNREIARILGISRNTVAKYK